MELYNANSEIIMEFAYLGNYNPTS